MLGRKKEMGEGERRKNTSARYSSFGKLHTLANEAPDWCSLGEVD